ncbi:hypothetical protein DF186_23320, partial [Enterococcus hirae]
LVRDDAPFHQAVAGGGGEALDGVAAGVVGLRAAVADGEGGAAQPVGAVGAVLLRGIHRSAA